MKDIKYGQDPEITLTKSDIKEHAVETIKALGTRLYDLVFNYVHGLLTAYVVGTEEEGTDTAILAASIQYGCRYGTFVTKIDGACREHRHSGGCAEKFVTKIAKLL